MSCGGPGLRPCGTTRMSFLRSWNHGRRLPGGRLRAACQPAGGPPVGVGVVVVVPVWPPMVPVDPLDELAGSVVVADVEVLLEVDGALLVEESVAVTVVVDVTVVSSPAVDELEEEDESAPPLGSGSSTEPVSGVPVVPPPSTVRPPWSPPDTGVPLIIS